MKLRRMVPVFFVSALLAYGCFSACAGKSTVVSSAVSPAPSDSQVVRKPTSQTDLPEVTAAASVNAPSHCPDGMVFVDGQYCPDVSQRCLQWLDPEDAFPRRCGAFAPSICNSRVRRHISVCMDKYEYPNQPGQLPPVDLTWYRAKALCEQQGKRLCTNTEWTFACEGEDVLPYPYGLVRDPTACNFNRSDYLVPNRRALSNPATHQAELARIYQAQPSGQFPRCVSPFGVHDMTGNVDEWTFNVRRRPYDSALKGGYWGPVRNACRPETLVHNEGFAYYQIGFRCCGDPHPVQ